MEAEDICDHPNSQRGSKKKNENCKRFTDEQVKLLESIFKVETKLEPRKKLQLARDIGLQPRQVAIWFQNRRARWKSKQLEHEYRILKENFDNLNGKFESLKTEKETLLTQLRALNDQIEKNHGGGGSSSRSQDSKDNEMYTSSENGELKNNSPDCSNARLLEDKSVKEVNDDDDDDDDTTRTTKYLRLKEETEYWNMDEFGEDSSLASPEYCFDQSCDNSKWWDFCS